MSAPALPGASSPTALRGPTGSGRAWPAIVLLLLAGAIGGQVVIAVAASRAAGLTPERDYYARALAWDADRRADLGATPDLPGSTTSMSLAFPEVGAADGGDGAALEASRRLGWQVELRLGPAGRDGRLVEVVAADAAGAPVAPAAVRLEALHPAAPGEVVRAALPATGPGRHAATLPLRRPGRWELRLTVERRADRWVEARQVEVGP